MTKREYKKKRNNLEKELEKTEECFFKGVHYVNQMSEKKNMLKQKIKDLDAEFNGI
jgi:septal ring factor EnvC (AmiA/AmiB activator)